MADDLDPAAVPITPAATVMMIRDAHDAPAGLEVFMLRRTASASFGAGMYVFPGGRVDGADGGTHIETFCAGLDGRTASARLGLASGGLAYWVASIRECFEEAGILLATRRDGGPLELDNDDRHAVHDGTLSLAQLCARDDLVLDLSTTHYVSHWITPLGEQRRFDTRFFLTEAPPGQEGLHDDKETVESLWVRPAEALQLAADRELKMMPPTIANLRFLAAHETAADALAAAAETTDIPAILPKLRRDDAGKITGVSMPNDPDYVTL